MLQPDESNWLKSTTSIRSSFCKDLHAKCYLNENEAILTSMNLYEFSQVNNNEMGIHIDKATDPDLYKDIYEEAQRLIRISDEIVISVERLRTKRSRQLSLTQNQAVMKKMVTV
jgi:phosphatidylserine/phosphatidylglycerophosphate/cardiolipin synthase-like enzyme